MTTGTLRPIQPVVIPHIHQATMTGACPTIELVDPRTLWVDEEYQRNLSDRSIALLRKIVGYWDWRKFKPPVVEALFVDGERQLHVIDGQHTAIGAATRHDIQVIPVVVNDGTSLVQDRANAFIGHNADRIAVTANQIFYAQLAAKDPVALRIHGLCTENGIKLLKAPKIRYEANDTVALGALKGLVKKRTDEQMKLTLGALAGADLAPIPSDVFKAIDSLLWSPWYEVTPSVLRLVIRNKGTDAINEAKLARAHGRFKTAHAALVSIYLSEANRAMGTAQPFKGV